MAMSLVTQEKVTAFLRDAEHLGLVADARIKIEREEAERRKTLISELAAVSRDREKALPPLIKAMRAGESRVAALHAQLAVELRSHYEAAIARDGAEMTFDRREFTLRQELIALAPDVLNHADIRLDRLADLLKSQIYFRAIGMPGASGYGIELKHTTNLPETELLLAEIKAKRVLLAEMVYSSTSSATIKENCSAILKEIRSKVAGLFPNSQLNEMLGESSDELPEAPRVVSATPPESLATRMKA